jgi:hypothetical protein
LTVGLIVAKGYKNSKAWIVKLETPIELHNFFYTQPYSTFQAVNIDCFLDPFY